jgi:dienelactone hydrolase
MDTPIWIKPAAYGAGVGAVALAIVGFSWGGWMTESKANEFAATKSRLAVVAALVPICLNQSKNDPKEAETLEMLKSATPYQRGKLLMDAGWATMPGAPDPNRTVAQACASELSTNF